MLKLVVDNLDSVAEEHRSLYVERDGKFHLKVEGYEDPTPIKRNLEAARRSERELKRKIEAWEKIGKTEEEIAALIAKHEERELTESERKGEWEKLKQQLVEKHAGELQKFQNKIGELEKQLIAKDGTIHELLVETAADAAIAEHEGDPDLLKPFVLRQLKVVAEDGQKPSVKIYDPTGTLKMNSKGEPMSVSELVSDMRQNEKFGRLFKGTGTTGSGANPPIGGNKPPSTQRRSDFKTEKERAAFVDKFGLPAYNALPV